MSRLNRHSDYLTARAANPHTGRITPSIPSRPPSPMPDLSAKYPDLTPARAPPKEQPLRGTGQRLFARRRQAASIAPSEKPDETLCAMNVPTRVRRAPSTPPPGGARSASLGVLATKLHMTPPGSEASSASDDDEDTDDDDDGGATTVRRRSARPLRLPTVRLVRPALAGVPRAAREALGREARAHGAELRPRDLLFWALVGLPGLLVWRLWLFVQQDFGTTPRARGPKSAVLLAARALLAALLAVYVLRIAGTLVETARAVAWPLRLAWAVLCAARR